jgi:phosphoribosyl 1,2-cyclic phosphate phosphodiesterase
VKVTILGSGTSSGVPRIDGDWGRCDPAEPRNRRRRVSILVEHDGTRILVDTSPDLREQLLAEGGGRPSAVIWTHEHADHCHGIDDLRPFFYGVKGPIPGYARPRTLAALEHSFAFSFFGHQGYPPYVSGNLLPDTITIGEIEVTAVDLPHGAISSLGLRFQAGGKSISYFTDFNDFPLEAELLVRQTDVWIVDAVRRQPHPTHPHLEKTLSWISALGPRRSILTHMDQTMDYAELCAELPPGVEPGFDNMVVEL